MNLQDISSGYLETDLIENVITDVDIYYSTKKNVNRVLLFPPFNSFHRLLIHKVIEHKFPQLFTFSVGVGVKRRTVVCFKKSLIKKPIKHNMSNTMQVDNLVKNCEKTASIGIYRPPALRNKFNEGALKSKKGSTVLKNGINDNVKVNKSKKRPDMQVYVPKGRRNTEIKNIVNKNSRQENSLHDLIQDEQNHKKKFSSIHEKNLTDSSDVRVDLFDCDISDIISKTTALKPEKESFYNEDANNHSNDVISYTVKNCDLIEYKSCTSLQKNHGSTQCVFEDLNNKSYAVEDKSLLNSLKMTGDIKNSIDDTNENVLDITNESNLKIEDNSAKINNEIFNEENLFPQNININSDINNPRKQFTEKINLDSTAAEINTIVTPLLEENCNSSFIQSAKQNNHKTCDEWESMFDDDGECVDSSVINDITTAVGKVEIEKPKIDYLKWQSEPSINSQEYGHILEVYDFPESFKTQELLSAFSEYKDNFDIKWVDDTHALAVFSSPMVAADAVLLKNPFIKTRPLNLATKQSKQKAKKVVGAFQPYKPRPQTSAALARRLVSGALGLKVQIPHHQREAEREKLASAREKKRIEKRQKSEAWEGNF